MPPPQNLYFKYKCIYKGNIQNNFHIYLFYIYFTDKFFNFVTIHTNEKIIFFTFFMVTLLLALMQIIVR